MLVMERTLQLRECLLRASQIASLESLPNRGEVLLSRADLESVSVGQRAALGESLNRREVILGGGQIAGLEVFAELLQVGLALLEVTRRLVDHTTGNARGEHKS